MKDTTRKSFLLLLASAIWGAAFVAQTSGGDAIGAYSFNSLRCIIGVIVLIPVMLIFDKAGLSPKKPTSKAERKTLWKAGILCGVALAIASNCQQLALNMGVSTGKAGFLTAIYILIVPILGIFIKRRCGLQIWIAVFIALIGMYFLCMKGGMEFSTGDLLVLVCAFVFSFQILFVDHYSPKVDNIRLCMVQFIVTAILSAIPAVFTEVWSPAGVGAWAQAFLRADAWISLLYAGVLSCGVAYTLQIFGQNGLNPAIASLIMSLESVFSALFGWMILQQSLSHWELFGCGLIFIAILLAQIPLFPCRLKHRHNSTK